MAGGFYLANHFGGNGMLLGGVPGVLPGKVTILGGGTAGMNAAIIAKGMGARVTVLDLSQERMRYLSNMLGTQVQTVFSTGQHIVEELKDTDLLVGAVLIPGAAAPKLLDRDMLRSMKKGSVFVDISIDQGGCSVTSKPTSHENPVFIEEGVLHYCVTNMPGAYARTSTEALAGNTLPYVKAIADTGVEEAVRSVSGLREGLNTHNNRITNSAVSTSLGIEYGESSLDVDK
jgi:alanine dehydrogenase